MSVDNRSIPVAVGRPKAESSSRAANGAETAEPMPHTNTPLIDIHEGPDACPTRPIRLHP